MQLNVKVIYTEWEEALQGMEGNILYGGIFLILFSNDKLSMMVVGKSLISERFFHSR